MVPTLIAALAMLAPPADSQAVSTGSVRPPTAQQLREAVRHSLRQQAVSPRNKQAEAIAKLLATYEKLKQDHRLAGRERRRLLTKVRHRLATIAVAARRDPILAQQLGNFVGGQGLAGGKARPGEALSELIKKVIAPETWDDQGGQGAIVVWRR
jgi:hypothetical protein